MNHQNYHKTAGVVFLLIAIFHLWTALTSMPIAYGTNFMPMWANWAIVIVAGYLSYLGLKKRI